ncbi:UNVERIFIED_CONTAM: Retrovirus-related Pol polyprotein from transposon RE2 [Sesamum angustifolium]|uniref:Retrovirus-related Pol polyprotein from transposon RE2 n=1 Tax=Sesamum angustifolium TaxID=2727405 RepID=A0AAW2L839_9LAMI
MASEGEHHANTSAPNSGRRREQELPEFLQLHGGDHPRMILVSTPFDGNDFLAWRRSVVIALRAKMKLGFIDGRYIMPDKTSETYDTWVRVDSMHAIASITQGTLSIVEYFNNLSALWDELECLKPPKVCTCGLCTCGVTKVTTGEDNLTKLVQFLMGLDDSYDNIRNQILVMDPFPSVNKAYSMVLRVERQRTVNMHASDVGEGVALHTRWNDHKGGHTKESCFKLHGVPDWYKQLKDQKVKETGSARGFNVITADAGNDSENASNLRDAVKQMTELIKLMKENIPQQDPLQVNFAHGDDFAGTSALVTPSENGFGLWIVDTEPCPVVATPQNLTTPTFCSTSTIQASSLPHSAPTNTTTLRRSQRQVNQPHWLQDFICNHTSSSFLDPICHSSFSPAHMRFLAQVEAVHEPKSFKEANQSSHWREAMNKEIEALEKNSTWELKELPAGKRAIGSRWVYKVKLNQDGSIERYKARLVAKGYTQIEGIDFFDNFSPMAKTVTVRLFIAIATARHWPILQLDVNNAVLHGHLDEEVYMVPPEGYAKARDGLHYLDALFTIKDLGHAKFFLGLELARSTHGTFITQKKYLMDIVRDCHLEEAKPAATPLPVGIKFDASTGPALPSPDRYRKLVGRLLYLGFSRPDISFAVQQLSQFLQHPREPHWDAALHLVRYLKGSSTLGLFFGTDSPLTLSAFSDSDWASCLDTRRSVTGYCVFLGGSLVSWKTKKQATVSRSSAEAEYRSMASTVCELLWISYILGDFGITVVSPIPFHCDNKAAIHITENPVFHERTKHLDIDCHIVRDRFKSGFILPQHISTQHQVADIFTKALPAPQFTVSCPSWACFLMYQLEGGLSQVSRF